MPPAADLLPLLDAALRGALVALLAVLAVALRRQPVARAQPAGQVGPWLMAGLVVQVLAAAPVVEALPPHPALAPWIGISVGNSVLFWLFARALFDDGFAPGPRHSALWAAVAGLGLLFYALVVLPQQRHLAPGPLAVAIAMRWVPVLFAALALWRVVAGWQGDLVEPRRALRLFVVLAGGVYTLVTAAARLASDDGRLSPALALLDVAMLLAIAAVLALRLLRLRALEILGPPGRRPAPVPGPGPLQHASAIDAAPQGQAALPLAPPAEQAPQSTPSPSAPADGPAPAADSPAAAAAAADPADDRLAEALHALMTGPAPWRHEDLSIGALAARLGAPEYRLRRVIHQRLGHRHFSSYIHGFRLADAAAALADPARRGLPVLTIALTSGFQSIGPFNRAFKAAYGCTPTDYRRRALGPD